MAKMTVVIGMVVVALVAGCAATQPQLPQQKSPESSDFLFQAKATANQGGVEARVEVRGTAEVIKEVGSGFARAQWCGEQKAVAILRPELDKTALTDTTVVGTVPKERK